MRKCVSPFVRFISFFSLLIIAQTNGQKNFDNVTTTAVNLERNWAAKFNKSEKTVPIGSNGIGTLTGKGNGTSPQRPPLRKPLMEEAKGDGGDEEIGRLELEGNQQGEERNRTGKAEMEEEEKDEEQTEEEEEEEEGEEEGEEEEDDGREEEEATGLDSEGEEHKRRHSESHRHKHRNGRDGSLPAAFIWPSFFLQRLFSGNAFGPSSGHFGGAFPILLPIVINNNIGGVPGEEDRRPISRANHPQIGPMFGTAHHFQRQPADAPFLAPSGLFMQQQQPFFGGQSPSSPNANSAGVGFAPPSFQQHAQGTAADQMQRQPFPSGGEQFVRSMPQQQQQQQQPMFAFGGQMRGTQ